MANIPLVAVGAGLLWFDGSASPWQCVRSQRAGFLCICKHDTIRFGRAAGFWQFWTGADTKRASFSGILVGSVAGSSHDHPGGRIC